MELTSVRASIVSVKKRAEDAFARRQQLHEGSLCVVAVSKTKPVADVIEAYQTGHFDFGESYVAELVQKATDPLILEKCADIRWHFVGHLQTNKVNRLMGAPNLYMIHSIESAKKADLVDAAWGKLQKPNPLKVMIQVNISNEEGKSGVSPPESYELAEHVKNKCPNLSLVGLMAIGTPGHNVEEEGPNPEFEMLHELKNKICDKFGLFPDELSLSMGMSHDFEHAIELGSNYVRVGTSIFGAREKKQE